MASRRGLDGLLHDKAVVPLLDVSEGKSDHLREKGVTIVVYVDDLVVASATKREEEQALRDFMEGYRPPHIHLLTTKKIVFLTMPCLPD